MKNRQIYISIGVFIALIIAFFLARRGPNTSTVTVGYKNLIENYSPSNIVKIELYKGTDKNAATILAKCANGWEIESSYHVPANSKKVQEVLDSLSTLEGKLRASGKDYFEDFQLTDDTALHIVLSGQNNQHHLLIGKKEGGQEGSFVRLAVGNEVYFCDKDVRASLGLWGDVTPNSDEWIEKQFLKLDKERIQQIAYNLTGKTFVFKKLEKKIDNQIKTDENKDIKKDKNKPQEKKEYEWKLTDWDKVYEVNETEIKNIASKATSLSAEKAVDPTLYPEDIFKKTNCFSTITMADNTKHVIQFALKDEQYYVKEEGSPFIYKIASYEKKKLAPNAGEFLNIKIPEIADIEARNIIDYRIDTNWKGTQETTRKLKSGDTFTRVSYSLEDNKTIVRFDTDNMIFIFDKTVHDKLNKKEEEKKNDR